MENKKSAAIIGVFVYVYQVLPRVALALYKLLL